MKINLAFISVLFLFLFNISPLLSLDVPNAYPSLEELLEKIDPHSEIDKQAALVVQHLGYGYYDESIEAIVPIDPKQIEQAWKADKEQIAGKIGDILPVINRSLDWENKSSTVEDLLRDAEKTAPVLKELLENVANQSQTQIYLGPDNQFMIKTKDSLEEKVYLDVLELGLTREQAVLRIGDALRGTIISEHAESIPIIAKLIEHEITERGGQVEFNNIWMQERPLGYLAVHAKLLIPIPGEASFMITEVQIHLAAILDGSMHAPKERAHIIYKKLHEKDRDEEKITTASKLIYLTAIRNYLSTHE